MSEDGRGECQRCGEVDYDRRTLWMACFYQMGELGLPFEEEALFHAKLEECEKAADPVAIGLPGGRQINIQAGKVRCHGELTPMGLYTLRVCKDCRADWMQAITTWFRATPARESCGSGIFVRRNGATIEVSLSEYESSKREEESSDDR